MNWRSNSHQWTKAFLLLCVAAVLPASAPAQIPGTTTQITANPFDQLSPAISGNLICYTDYRLGPGQGEVWCHDLAANTDFQVTTANLLTNQLASGLSGNTAVYTQVSSGASTVYGCVIASETYPPCSPIALGSGYSFSPAIDGSLVAWVDGSTGSTNIYAVDLNVPGAVKQLTQNAANNNSLTPSVSGRNVAYSTGADPHSNVCQVFVTNFDSLTTTQLTNSANGCNGTVNIDGNYVVYQANRDGDQDIYVYNMTTLTETRIALPGLQQNAHISGDWVSFEDVASAPTANVSSLRLYQISIGVVYTAVQASTQLQSAFLNDLDGYNLAYTSAAAGNYDIFLFRFTPPGIPLTITANPVSRLYGHPDPPFTVSYSGFVGHDDPSVLGGTLACTSNDTIISAASGVPIGGGPYMINCGGLTSSFYTITFVPGILTITPAPLTVTANSFVRPYGANNPTLTGVFAGLLNGDSFNAIYATTATPSSPPGNYPIVPAVAQSTTAIQDYAITIVNGTLTVLPEQTVLTVSLSPSSISVGHTSIATTTLTAPDLVFPLDPSTLPPVSLSSPVLSDILSNNGVCTLAATATPNVVSCMITVTSVEPNGRTVLANFQGTTNLSRSTATAELMVTAALQSQASCINSDFRNVAVTGGSYIWFNSIFKVRDVGQQQKINISFYQSSVKFQYTDPAGNLVSVNQSIPDAKIVIDPTLTTASTTFDPVNNVWVTSIPFDLDDNAFLTGLPWLVPAAGLPADVEPVTWCGTFASDNADIDIGWRWAAAAYSSFSGDNTVLGVKPMDTDHDNSSTNHDRVGTPENFKNFVVPGARGKGGKNYAGSYSRSAIIE
jgi:beta propeller repeat protein